MRKNPGEEDESLPEGYFILENGGKIVKRKGGKTKKKIREQEARESSRERQGASHSVEANKKKGRGGEGEKIDLSKKETAYFNQQWSKRGTLNLS